MKGSVFSHTKTLAKAVFVNNNVIVIVKIIFLLIIYFHLVYHSIFRKLIKENLSLQKSKLIIYLKFLSNLPLEPDIAHTHTHPA